MAKVCRTSASKPKRRDYKGLPQLVVKLCGCSLTMAYKVIRREAVSAKVEQAVEDAKRLLTKNRPARARRRAA